MDGEMFRVVIARSGGGDEEAPGQENTVQRGKKGPADAAVDWGGSRTSWQYSADSRAPSAKKQKRMRAGGLLGEWMVCGRGGKGEDSTRLGRYRTV